MQLRTAKVMLGDDIIIEVDILFDDACGLFSSAHENMWRSESAIVKTTLIASSTYPVSSSRPGTLAPTWRLLCGTAVLHTRARGERSKLRELLMECPGDMFVVLLIAVTTSEFAVASVRAAAAPMDVGVAQDAPHLQERTAKKSRDLC
ncbi:hypothetical protein CGC20_2205 [Leishmania donovani]|uniref:Uncharacterized protein n=1 Tax=Leishmania donovani TaxID=5661 RepID=A0A504XZ73_LEIDO|nr:hypothetical protein CGC20_2205 [Leishmania donovani]